MKPNNCNCGGEGDLIFLRDSKFNDTKCYRVRCVICGIATKVIKDDFGGYTKEEAIKSWNAVMNGKYVKKLRYKVSELKEEIKRQQVIFKDGFERNKKDWLIYAQAEKNKGYNMGIKEGLSPEVRKVLEWALKEAKDMHVGYSPALEEPDSMECDICKTINHLELIDSIGFQHADDCIVPLAEKALKGWSDAIYCKNSKV